MPHASTIIWVNLLECWGEKPQVTGARQGCSSIRWLIADFDSLIGLMLTQGLQLKRYYELTDKNKRTNLLRIFAKNNGSESQFGKYNSLRKYLTTYIKIL
ncbi:hypothetical protein BIU88_02780 [Chlorobaculum limnaeum]|uniref:Uncharacterized protein n=1 Tax=Chlorobaculum limnaeum TaxID=274537 RepID=A0A1D8CWA6_CHLLM|nr:hypothetical protein BIU88_02780 [Chlorobaculum limnaeum]